LVLIVFFVSPPSFPQTHPGRGFFPKTVDLLGRFPPPLVFEQPRGLGNTHPTPVSFLGLAFLFFFFLVLVFFLLGDRFRINSGGSFFAWASTIQVPSRPLCLRTTAQSFLPRYMLCHKGYLISESWKSPCRPLVPPTPTNPFTFPSAFLSSRVGFHPHKVPQTTSNPGFVSFPLAPKAGPNSLSVLRQFFPYP